MKDIEHSRDKVFLIQRHDTGRSHPEWHLIRININKITPNLQKKQVSIIQSTTSTTTKSQNKEPHAPANIGRWLGN
jgi:hypothetical protein